MKNFLFFLLLLSSFSVFSLTKINLDEQYLKHLEKVEVDLVDKNGIYVNDEQSTALFYYALSPQNPIEGALVLFPPTWQKAEKVINHNIELLQLASDNNLLIVVPSINYNLYLDAFSMSFLNQTFKHVMDRYAPPADKFVFGGFSLGGMNAIRYTELALEGKTNTAIKPQAVYGVDPPLDFARLYRSFERTIEKNFSQPAMNEAKDYLRKLDTQFGGSPEEYQSVYVRHSMYSKSAEDGGNAKFLSTIPVRIYCDPDIDWQMKERRMDMYDMNAADHTAMINHLLLMGNDKAEFINALGKGYRLDGRRHPHSWSLVDPEECIDWILGCLD